MAVHPRRDIVVSGQAGKEAIVCLFDATGRWPEESDRVGREGGDARAAGSGATAATTPVFLREFSLGRKEKQGVRERVGVAGRADGGGKRVLHSKLST